MNHAITVRDLACAIVAAAALGAGAFVALWARNGFRGLPERSR